MKFPFTGALILCSRRGLREAFRVIESGNRAQFIKRPPPTLRASPIV